MKLRSEGEMPGTNYAVERCMNSTHYELPTQPERLKKNRRWQMLCRDEYAGRYEKRSTDG